MQNPFCALSFPGPCGIRLRAESLEYDATLPSAVCHRRAEGRRDDGSPADDRITAQAIDPSRLDIRPYAEHGQLHVH